MGLTVQIACTGLICSLCGCMGIMFAWPSSTLRLFESYNTTLHRPMTETELALFGSLSSVGAIIGTPILGMLLDRIGRKNSAMLASLMGVALVCSLCGCMGIMFAWPSSTLRLFESYNTTLHRPMTETELALFGSLSSVGAIIGTPILGMLLDRIGRKNSAMLASLMGVVAWTMIASSSRVEVLLTAVFVAGLSGAVFLVAPVYVGEICDESIRGAMCSGTMVVYAGGMLVSYLLGGYLDYRTMVYASLSLAVLVTALLLVLKESPTHLMAKGLDKEAAISIAFYRSVKPDSKEVVEEMNVIRRALNPELDDLTPEEEKQLKPDREQSEKLSLFQFIKKSSSTRKAISLTLIMITASIFQGLVVVQVYAEPLFEEAIPTMSPNLGSILLAVVGIVSGVIAAVLTECAGRRPLMIYSSFATGASCLLLGLQLQLHWGPHWLIAVNMYFFTMVYSFGAATVPYVLFAEVFLPEVKSILTMVVVEWAWVCNSIILFIFNPLLKAIGLGPVFYLFAGVSILTGVYSIFYLPETKGLTIDAIQDQLSNKKVNKKDRVY